MQFWLAGLIVWFAGAALIVISGAKNPESYILILFSLIQLFAVISVRKKVNRKIEGDVLIQSKKPPTIAVFLFRIMLLIVLTTAYIFTFKKLESVYWIAILIIVVSGAAATYFIVKGRRIPFLILYSDELIVNEALVKRYDLKNLERISFDGFNENYTFVFSNARKLVLRPVDYGDTDMDNLISVIKIRSGRNVSISANLVPVN